LGLETQPGEMMAWTLQNYGAYVNDSTGGGSDTAFDTEQGPDGNFVKNFEAMWSYSFTGYIFERTNNSYMPGGDPFLRDMQKVMKLLQVIDNNAPSSIGGGGTPLQPLAPPFQ
jgi:hypothetical protein